MTPQEKVIKVARAEIGYLEKATNSMLDDPQANPGHNNWTKYARDLDASGCYNGKKNGYAWCDMFVDWCFREAFGEELMHKMTCQPHGFYGAGCTESARYFKNNGRWFTHEPAPGDQIFFTKDGGKSMYHTGLVVDVKNGQVYTVEGNTSSAPGVVENGGCVGEKSYPLTYDKIGGFGRPNWGLAKEEDEVTEERVKELITEALVNIHQEQVYGTLKDVPPCYQPTVRKLMEAAVLNGYDIKDPDDLEDNVLNLTETMCRILLVLDQAGLFKKFK